ncbi:protein zyg-11 homolog [Trichomycterus rosablanca]|uniref:protein zyg-11 homolog n=1 Tax=Trichomycterus rosablanca TaxID=2290929 RepID=UPI002F3593C9
MDDAGPPSLVDVSLMSVCCNLEVLCSECDDGSLQLPSCPLFPPGLADLLLRTMTDRGTLNDRNVGIFRNVELLRLSRAYVRSSGLTAASFRRFLCSHHLKELDASHLCGNISVSDVVNALMSNQKSREGLQRLSVSGVRSFGDPSVRFSTLQSLRSLSVAWTSLDDSGLEDICSLQHLEKLDVSGTNVTDLTALRRLRSTLRSLTVHALHRLTMSADGLVSVLSEMKNLTQLDVSNDRLKEDEDLRIAKLLRKPRILPALVALDVSGWRGVSEADLKTFVEERQGMRFVGLLATGAGRCEVLSGGEHLQVAGELNLTQLAEALRRYRERRSFLQEALLHLYNLSNEPDVRSQPQILKLVCSGMKTHPECSAVQVTGSMCLYNLTSLDLAEQMPLGLMGNVVRHVLTTMRNFPDHKEIQKICLMILCNDHVLHNVPFNRYEAVKQVMKRVSCNEDEFLQTLCISILFLLLSQLSEDEMKQLGAEEVIIKLLCVVQQKASVGVCDTSLEFTLSALWSLTDNTHSACTHFLQCEGLELYTELLETYFSVTSVLQKVLGLLNNVSEMEDLREWMMDEELLEMMLTLMDVPQVGVSYFAAGVLANITSSSRWNLSESFHQDVLTKLHSAVMSWTPPDEAIVTYRSFGPFFRLLVGSRPSAVQLWSLWGINHVCTHNVSHYSRTLLDEGGLDTLRALTSDPDTHPDVHALAVHTLRLIEGEEPGTTHESVEP